MWIFIAETQRHKVSVPISLRASVLKNNTLYLPKNSFAFFFVFAFTDKTFTQKFFQLHESIFGIATIASMTMRQIL